MERSADARAGAVAPATVLIFTVAIVAVEPMERIISVVMPASGSEATGRGFGSHLSRTSSRSEEERTSPPALSAVS